MLNFPRGLYVLVLHSKDHNKHQQQSQNIFGWWGHGLKVCVDFLFAFCLNSTGKVDYSSFIFWCSEGFGLTNSVVVRRWQFPDYLTKLIKVLM